MGLGLASLGVGDIRRYTEIYGDIGEPGRGAATRVARLLVDRAEGGGVVLGMGRYGEIQRACSAVSS